MFRDQDEFAREFSVDMFYPRRSEIQPFRFFCGWSHIMKNNVKRVFVDTLHILSAILSQTELALIIDNWDNSQSAILLDICWLIFLNEISILLTLQ